MNFETNGRFVFPNWFIALAGFISDQGAHQVTAIIFLFRHNNRSHLHDKCTTILGLRVVYTFSV